MIKLKPEFRQQVMVDDDNDIKTELPKQRFLKNFLSALSPQTSLLICHDFDKQGLGNTISTIVTELQEYRHHMALPFKKAYIICSGSNKGLKQHLLPSTHLAIYNYRTFGHKLVECINANTVKQTFSDALIVVNDAHKIFNTNATTVLDKDMQLLATFLPHLFVNNLDLDLLQKDDDDDTKIKAYEDLLKSEPDKQKRMEMHFLKLLKADKASNLNFLLLSPSPMADVPQDIVPLLNLMLQNDQLSKIKVDDIFLADGSLSHDVLQAAMAGYVAYIHSVKPSINYIYPDEFRSPMNVTDKAVKHLSLYNVPSSHQLNIRQPLREFMQKNNSKSTYQYSYLPDKEEIFSLQHLPDYSPKIKQLLDCIGNGDGVILVYSKFLENGLIPVALALEQIFGFDRAKYPNLFQKNKHDSNNTYAFLTNDKRLTPKTGSRPTNVKVFLVSFSVADQYDLEFKNVRQIHILDPVTNLAKIDELIKTAKPPSLTNKKTNNIEIYLHCATTNENNSSDLELYTTALKKAEKIGQVMRILKENAQDCFLQQEQQEKEMVLQKKKIVVDSSCYKDLSILPTDRRPYAAVCDYMAKCEYKCVVNVVANDISAIIKKCFRRTYVITRQELVMAVCTQLKKLTCSAADIFAAADHLIKEKTPVKDFYGKDGSIVLIGSYYFYLPVRKS
jgi:hypothetical protein